MKQKPSLLLVEDDDSTRAALVRLLRNDYQLYAVNSSEAALAEIGKGLGPNLILSDYGLPGTSGLNFLQKMKSACPQALRILLTGHVMSDELTKALQDQTVHRIFLKPWENDMLLMQLQESLQQQKLIQDSHVLAELALRDSMTNLFNKKYFQEALKREFDRALRHHRQLSLILIDIDRFKDINDSGGHLSGDQAIIRLTEILNKSLRNIDVVARIGGDEFAIILPDAPESAAKDVGERIRQSAAATPTAGPKGDAGRMTISVGVGNLMSLLKTVPSDKASGLSADDFFSWSDKALYLAKQRGRNQTVVAG